MLDGWVRSGWAGRAASVRASTCCRAQSLRPGGRRQASAFVANCARCGCAGTPGQACVRVRQGTVVNQREKEEYLREYSKLKSEGKPFFPYAVAKDSLMGCLVIAIIITLSI